eukprot:209129_1
MAPCFWIIIATLALANAQTTNPTETTAIPIESATPFHSLYVISMITFGIMGMLIIPTMCGHSLINFYRGNLVKMPLRVLYGIFFVAYFSVCTGYALFRTDLILPMGSSISCGFGYYFTTNAVYFSKLMLWVVFMYRIDLAFHSSAMGYPRPVLICIMVTLFLISSGLNILFIFATKDIVTFLPMKYFGGAITGFCTFPSSDHGGMFTIAMGLLFLFDMIANITLCCLFTYKLRIVIKMGADCSGQDRKLQKLMRKQTTLVLVICITSMFVLALGALLYGVSLLMPLDALINAFCIWLMFSFSDPIWNKITHFCCFCCYCNCCGHKDDFMMTLHSLRGIRGSSLREEAASVTAATRSARSNQPESPSDVPGPISERVSQKQMDIEIKFENDITSDDLNKS